MSGKAIEFSEKDQPYQDWLANHPEGFVLTMLRSKPPDKMYLHRATCYKVKNYNRMTRPGGFTERDYIKICAISIGKLRDWVRDNGRPDGSFTSDFCPTCKNRG
jgi:hypothetical protein